jgi:hypothetical protein
MSATPSKNITPKKYPRKAANLPIELHHLTIDNFCGYIRCQCEDDPTSGSDQMVENEVIIEGE